MWYRQGKLIGNADALSRLVVNGLGPAVVNGQETVSRSEMMDNLKTTSSKERGKVMSGNELRSFKM